VCYQLRADCARVRMRFRSREEFLRQNQTASDRACSARQLLLTSLPEPTGSPAV
jgi:hypothetical protein